MKKRKQIFLHSISILLMAGMIISAQGCAPSFPREVLPEAVKEVCKNEYDMDVEVTLVGNTVGIYYPMEGLLDVGMGLSEEAWDTISNLLLIASRVVLSTDANIQFYCVITQDARLPELQVVIIKYVEDVKKGMYRNISRSEAFKRTLFSVNLTPQAKKERSIEKVFEKLGVEDNTRQSVLDEFFRSPPTKLSDIGYWRGTFYLKNVTMEEFIAAQIASRMKLDFRSDKDLAEKFSYKVAESSFASESGLRAFLVSFKIADQGASENEKELRTQKIKEIVRITNEVVDGYKFKEFDLLILDDQLENVQLRIDAQDVCNFNKTRTPVEDLAITSNEYF